MPNNDDRVQINVRVPPELADAIDAARIRLKAPGQSIPSRSELVRLAIETFLKQKPGG